MIGGPVSGKNQCQHIFTSRTSVLSYCFILGAHLNPAVSISLMTIRKLKPLQCVFYIIGQMFGAFFGALVVYWLHWNLFNKFDGGIRHVTGEKSTADIFFTMPADGVHEWNALFDQVVGTAILMIFIMALENVSECRLI
jgi:glycerol uptake facilitator-like aquaporin